MRARDLLLVIAAGVASAAFSYLGTGLHPIWWLLWLAPVPVLAVAPRLRRSAAFLLGSVAWLIGEINQWSYLTHEIGVPLKIVILFFVIPPVVLGFGGVFMRSFIRRGSEFLA
jgi:apolipoprotein N-acyltransferase